MIFKVTIPYRETKTKNKTFYIEYDIETDSFDKAIEIAKQKFNAYENYNMASWERIMFEDKIECYAIINNSPYKKDDLPIYFENFYKLTDEEKLFLLGELQKNPIENICNHLYKIVKTENISHIISYLISLIGNFNCSKNWENLLPFLDSNDARIRANTIETLEKLNIKEITPRLFNLLSDNNNRVRANTIKALWKFGEKNIGSHLEKMLQSHNSLMRASALYILGEIDFPDTLNLALPYLKDQDEIVRFNAGRTIYKIIKLEELNKLIPYLNNNDDIVRIYVKKCFLKFNEESLKILFENEQKLKKSVNTKNILSEIDEILREIGNFKLSKGDKIGFLKIFFKRIINFFKI